VKALNTVNKDVMVGPALVPGEHVLFVCPARSLATAPLGRESSGVRLPRSSGRLRPREHAAHGEDHPGGWINANDGDKSSFGGNAQATTNGSVSGQEEYQDKGANEDVHSINVTA